MDVWVGGKCRERGGIVVAVAAVAVVVTKVVRLQKHGCYCSCYRYIASVVVAAAYSI